MSFISKKKRMFKIRSRYNKIVKPNLEVFDNCDDFRLWSMDSFERHQALLDAIVGVQYEGEEEFASSQEAGQERTQQDNTTKQLLQEQAAQIEEYQAINQKLTSDNERMIQLLQKCEEEKSELSQINHELNQVRQRLTDQRKSIDIEQNCREKLEKLQKDYEAKITELKAELHSNANIQRVFEAQMQDLPAMVRELEDIKTRYNSEQQEMAKLRDELEKARKQNKDEYLNQLAGMEKELADLKRESKMFQIMLKEKEEFERNVKKSLSQSEEEKKLLEAHMATKLKTFESEKKAWAQKHTQICEAMKKTHDNLVEKLTNDAKKLQKDLEISEKEKEDLRHNCDNLKQERDKHAKENAQQVCRIKQLEEKIKTYSDKLVKAEEEVKNRACENEAMLKKQKENLEKIQCEHEKELKLVKAQEEEQKKSQKEWEAIRVKLNELITERDKMKTFADEQTALAKARENEIRDLKKEMKNLEKVNASLRESNDLLINNEKEMMQKLKLFEEARTQDQGENLQSRSDSHIPTKANQVNCKDCMCKVLVETDLQKIGDVGSNIKDVLGKALVDGLQCLKFNEIAQLHQHMQSALGQLLENDRIDLKAGAPVALSFLHKTHEPRKEVIRGKVEDVEKILSCQEKVLKNDVGCLQRGVTATKHRVDRLKEKAHKTSQRKVK